MRIVMRYPNGLAKAVTLSYDDGVVQDVRLIEIMSKHGLKGTFNINSGLIGEGQRLTKEEILKLYPESGNEVAVHGFDHPHYEEMYAADITWDVILDRKNLEEIFGTVIRGMAYPFGTYNDEVVNCLKACGIAYSRTVRSTHAYNLPTDWLRLDPTCHHADPKLMEMTDFFVNHKRRAHDPCLMFYLWGHSYEFDDNNNWEIIEEFAEKIGGKDDIWYATNIEIYDYVKKFRQMIYNAEGTKAYNPTDIDLWFSNRDGNLVKVPAGETVDF